MSLEAFLIRASTLLQAHACMDNMKTAWTNKQSGIAAQLHFFLQKHRSSTG
jgi:hypothetical protein